MSVHRERILEAATREMNVGDEIITADGDRLGAVSEIDGKFVKVNAPLRRDFWLNAEFLLPQDDGTICTSFGKKEAAAYRLSAPAPEAVEEEGQSTSSTILLSEEEQLEQRIAMERELAQQRRNLPHDHPEGEDAPPDTGGTLGEPVEVELARIESGAQPTYDPRAQAGSPRTTASADVSAKANAFHTRSGAIGQVPKYPSWLLPAGAALVGVILLRRIVR